MKSFFLKIIFIVFLFSYFAKSNEYFPYKIDLEKLTADSDILNLKGKAEIGKNIFASRKVNCLSCHEAPILEEKFQGNFGPPLYNIGSRYTKEEIRLRIINSKLINEDSIMPSYFKKIKNYRTPEYFYDKTILTVQEVEDITEYLYSLK